MTSIVSKLSVTFFDPKTNLPTTIFKDDPRFNDAVNHAKKKPQKKLPLRIRDPHKALRKKIAPELHPMVGSLTRVQAFKYLKDPEKLSDAITRANKVYVGPQLSRWADKEGIAPLYVQIALLMWRDNDRTLENFVSSKVFDAARRHGTMVRALNVKRNPKREIVDGTLETSQGVKVPLVEAIRAFRIMEKFWSKGKTTRAKRNKIKVGHYTITEIVTIDDRQFMKAGCHLINAEECRSLAISLGIYP